MRVLVTFAVDAEFAPWRKLRLEESQMRQQSGDVRCHARYGRALVLFAR